MDPGIQVYATLAIYALVVVVPPVYFTWRVLRRAKIPSIVGYFAFILLSFSYLLLATAGGLSTISYIFLSLIIAAYLYDRIGTRLAVLTGFIVSGLIGGSLVALYWPSEGAIYFDIWGCVVGEELHDWAINTLGDPYSPHASLTVPLVFRLPWVLLLGSLIVWSSIGVIMAILSKPCKLHRVLRMLRW